MVSDPASFTNDFKAWRTAVRMLDQHRMPPQEAPQPTAAERRQILASIKQRQDETALKHADDPGEVLLRRLTSSEYDYTIRDLTRIDLKLREELPGDAVGGEGFTNVGLVQFFQDSSVEQYLKNAKAVASHAVIVAGQLKFYEAPGKTGM
jgi:hypothetical protein